MKVLVILFGIGMLGYGVFSDVYVDWGLGIIRKRAQELVEKEKLTFLNLEKIEKSG